MRKKFYIWGIAFLFLFFGVQLAKPYSRHTSNNPLAADFFSICEDPVAAESLCEEEVSFTTDDSIASFRSVPFSFHAAPPVVQIPLDHLNLYILHHSYLI